MIFWLPRNIAQTAIPFEYVIIDNAGPNGIWQKTMGDINGDGRIDLIAGGQYGGGLVWYENPNWTKHSIATEGAFSTDAEVADVDKDGDNDVLSLTNSEIIWYENPSWTLHTIDSRIFHDLEVADFDKDGDIDVVARNQGEFGFQGDELHLYRQDTPTNWTHHVVSIADGEGLLAIDLDNDEDQDVIVNGSWFENKGDIINGSWTEHPYTTNWTHPNTFIAAGDINGDERLDIVLSPSELAEQSYRLSWFEAPIDPKSGDWIEHIVEDNVEAVHHFVGIADMDKDGDIDIASAEMEQGADPDEIKVYINEDGTGQSWHKQVIATTGSHNVRLIDVDNDSDMDLFGANWQGQQVEMWRNESCPPRLDRWTRHVVDPVRPWTAIFITAADLDGDAYEDIITGGWWYQNPGSPAGSWARHSFGEPLNNMVTVYDFDGDGKVDVLGTQGQGANADPRFVWGHNQGSGTFDILDNVEAGEGDFLQGVALGIFQAGEPVKVALSWHGADFGIQTLTVPVDPLTETWHRMNISATSQDEALSQGDIDRDGDQDLLLGTIWLENQENSWQEHTLHDTSGAPYGESDPDRNRLADLNNDGRLDAVVGYEAISIVGKLAWYEQGTKATSTWTEHVIANVVGPMSLTVVDMDQDNDLDVVVGEHNLDDPDSARLYIFENEDGQGSQWTEHVVYTGDEHHDGTEVVDIDNDGDLDIISIGWGHDQVLLYANMSPKCGPEDVTRISISNVTVHPLDTSATISWTTDLTATSQVTYGISPTLTMSTTETTNYVISHNIPLTGLISDTTYVYTIHSKDSVGNSATSAELNFTTLTSDMVKPVYLPRILKDQ